jgi:anti-sigma B factor antagonist
VEGDWDHVHDQDLLHISRARLRTAVVLTASGEVDLTSAPRLRAALTDVLGDPGTKDAGCAGVILDLTAVTFLGSTGLAVLVDANSQATAQRIPLRLIVDGRSGPVTRALQGAAIEEHLSIYPDVESALQASNAGR